MFAITADGVQEVEMQPDDSLKIVPRTCMVDVFDTEGRLRQNFTEQTADEVAAFLKVAPAGFQVIITVNEARP